MHHKGKQSRVAQGRAAEALAADFLQRAGYAVLDRNARGGRGELDLVVQKGELLVFVEVKAHRLLERSLQAVTPAKQQRLLSAAEVWLMRHPSLARLQCRFDLIMVAPDCADITHCEDAFRP